MAAKTKKSTPKPVTIHPALATVLQSFEDKLTMIEAQQLTMMAKLTGHVPEAASMEAIFTQSMMATAELAADWAQSELVRQLSEAAGNLSVALDRTANAATMNGTNRTAADVSMVRTNLATALTAIVQRLTGAAAELAMPTAEVEAEKKDA